MRFKNKTMWGQLSFFILLPTTNNDHLQQTKFSYVEYTSYTFKRTLVIIKKKSSYEWTVFELAII